MVIVIAVLLFWIALSLNAISAHARRLADHHEKFLPGPEPEPEAPTT